MKWINSLTVHTYFCIAWENELKNTYTVFFRTLRKDIFTSWLTFNNPHPSRQVEVWRGDLGFIQCDWPQFEQPRRTQSIFPVQICAPHDFGGGGLAEHVVVLHAVWTVIRGEKVTVKSMLGDMMIVTMTKLAQVTDSCKTKATQLIHILTEQNTSSRMFMSSKYDSIS